MSRSSNFQSKQSVGTIIRILKHSKIGEGKIIITTQDCVIGYLRPLAMNDPVRMQRDIELLTSWRQSHYKSFFTWGKFSEEMTHIWIINSYIDNDNDIIFIVESNECDPYGMLSLYNIDESSKSCEFGRVLRGCQEGPKSGMTFASKALLKWAVEELQLSRFILEVFEENTDAIAMYERCGFQRVDRLPLIAHQRGDVIQWKYSEEIPKSLTSFRWALRMELIITDKSPGGFLSKVNIA